MNIELMSASGKKLKQAVDVSDAVFACEYNEALVHQVVTAYLAGARAGTHAQKNRASVSGGGAKPWRQKGMGRARAGTIRSPLWRHGGVTFAAQPSCYAKKVNKRMYRGAMRVILSQLLKDNRLVIVGDLVLESHKTKDFVSLASKMNLVNPLIIIDGDNRNLELATRNIPGVNIINVSAINPVDLLAHEHVVIVKEALLKVNEAFTQ